MLDDASVSNLALFWAWKQRYKHLVVGSESSSYQLLLYVLSQNLPLVELWMLSSRGSPLHALLPTSSQLLSEPHYVPKMVLYPVIEGNENKFNKEIQDNQTI